MKFTVLFAFWGSLLCLCWSVDQVQFFEKGGELHLRPNKSGPLTNVVWLLNNDLVAEWDAGHDVVYYGNFTTRTTLNTVTGELKISGVRAQDRGTFTLELNKVSQQNAFIVKIISPVPKPQIHVSPVACSKDSVRCKLHCGGDTGEAEPVTFQWTHNSDVKTEDITIDVINQEVEGFSCFMTNPISQKKSEPFANPFYQEKDNISPGGIAGLVIMFLVVVVAAVVGALFYCHKRKRHEEGTRPTSTNRSERVPLDEP
ncbi:uncharacterized protein LOC133559596 [Nerophis ophidion]|uniref:uncharacterized protein LOC133559596 n=1 Tax=Nerophis ophidion TaxID=159077 RepID=UPI002AE07080|nr:uncharacterized protein LOC133559596 [Nerophis ophidion]